MKVFKYNIDTESFEGFAEIEVPNYQERISILKTMNFDIKTSGEIDTKTAIDRIADIERLVSKHVKVIYVKSKQDDSEIRSIEDLGYYSEGSKLINTIG